MTPSSRPPGTPHPKAGSGGSVVDAVLGPTPLLVGMLAAAGPLALGVPVPTVVAVGVVAGLAVTGPGIGRARRAGAAERAAEEAWRAHRDATVARRRVHWAGLEAAVADSIESFARAVDTCWAGPLRDRVEEMVPDVERAGARATALARLGLDLDRAIADAPAQPRPSAHPRRRDRRRRRPRPRPPQDAAPTALRRQRDEAETELRAIDASLRAAVAAAFALALDSLDDGSDDLVDDVVAELDALRDALAELSR